MAGTILQLQGSAVASIVNSPDGWIGVRFDPAMIVKSEGIPQVDASTLWTQAGELVIGEAEIDGEPSSCAGSCGGSPSISASLITSSPAWVHRVLASTWGMPSDFTIMAGPRRTPILPSGLDTMDAMAEP